jgi:hypothetical protein
MAKERGRPKKADSERRDIRYQIRLSASELAQIERAGGGNPSTWAREVLLSAARRRVK